MYFLLRVWGVIFSCGWMLLELFFRCAVMDSLVILCVL